MARRPILRPEMLRPVDAPISFSEACRVLAEYFVAVGLSRDTASAESDHLWGFREKFNERAYAIEASITFEEKLAEEQLPELEREVEALRRALAQASDLEARRDLNDELKDVLHEVKAARALVARVAAKRSKAQPPDLRQEVVRYANQVTKEQWIPGEGF